MTPDEAVKKLDALYANPKYGELDLGQALQLLTASTSAGEGMSSDAAAPVNAATSAAIRHAPAK
jgi:hypothetical protein